MDAADPFTCLPNGDEHLVVHIAGTPSLDLTNPVPVKCLSQYLAARDDDGALLDFDWIIGTSAMSVVVRLDNALPGQTGTFTPFAVAISNDSGDAWLGLQDKCHVSITASQKIGSGTMPDYKVSGSLACDAGWALGKPDAVLQQFEFTTRVVDYP
jgi:hypothetical protein